MENFSELNRWIIFMTSFADLSAIWFCMLKIEKLAYWDRPRGKYWALMVLFLIPMLGLPIGILFK